jgi:membrane protease YdiL (CAAX protease family)
LREVVRVVADAMNLPSLICPTPVVLMRVPVRIMEAVMKQPLSTSAQLAMLAEGLDGAPGPARAELGLSTAPFTATRIRRLLRAAARTAPLDLRLFSAGAPRREITGASFGFIVLFAIGALSVIFGAASDRWMGMTIAMGLAVIGAMFIPAVRRRLKPSLFQIAAGAGTGIALYGITLLVVAFFSEVWPQWETAARTLYAWRNGHSALFLAPTLALIVFAEEVVWRGVVTRFLMERWGRMPGIALAALIYALAHWATFNPLLLLAALGCGLYWGWLFAATDNLIGPIVAHLLWDAFMVFLFPVVR